MDEVKDPIKTQDEISNEEKDRMRKEEFDKKLAAERAEREKSKGGKNIYKYAAMAIGILIVLGAAFLLAQPSSSPTGNSIAVSNSGGYLIAGGNPISEIYCERSEGNAMHIHSQLQVYVDGKAIEIPATVGQTSSCLYWLHTHTPDGVIHIESPVVKTFMLGQFLDVWGKQLFNENDVVKVFIDKQDGKGFQEFSGDYRTITLTSHEVIAIGTGEFTPKPFTFGYGL